MKKWTFLLPFLFLFACQHMEQKTSFFESNWPKNVERVWIGPEYWSNRLQDWRLRQGRLECTKAAPNRSVNILTRQLSERPGDVSMRVVMGGLQAIPDSSSRNWAGFRVGIRGEFHDYRDSAVHGHGLNVGLTTAGRLFIGSPSENSSKPVAVPNPVLLKLAAHSKGEMATITISLFDPKTGKRLASLKNTNIPSGQLVGNLALVSDFPEKVPLKNGVCVWFKDWKMWGSKLSANPSHDFGPILFSQYTLSRRILKMTAQMPPLGKQDARTVALQIRGKNRKWKTIQEVPIDTLARTATFRVTNWDDSRDVPYRLTYSLIAKGGKTRLYTWEGIVRHNPLEKKEFVLSAFTGNNDLGFPNDDLVRHVAYQNPDMLFFSGDQIYENVGGFGVQRAPLKEAVLDYLRKWYLYGWAYRDLLKDRPTVSIPDDHDVFQGNLWGAGGKKAAETGSQMERQDSGGYTMPAVWVNMIQRTQTSHLPDPFDPRPVRQGIGVYFCELNYGGISFAILEDRKFKSAPKVLLPQAKVVNGWAQNPDFDPVHQADVPGAVLLGARQLKFLRHWATTWDSTTWMKVALSQTIFSDVVTLPAEESNSDHIVPRLRILKVGEYPPNDIPVADMDSDGWPQSGRNRAIREFRRALALHIAGDQHLGSTIQYGIKTWRDAGFAFCVPAISNIWPRRWFPREGGKNRRPGAPRYTGDFLDGFGNHVTVYAVSNPVFTGLKPARLYDRATGYGIVRFDRKNHRVRIECWPRETDPAKPDAKEYPGWPITISQADNDGRKPLGYLPTIQVTGVSDPVVQVVEEKSGEILYTLRISGQTFAPKVFAPGLYTVRVGASTTGAMKERAHLKPMKKGAKTLRIEF